MMLGSGGDVATELPLLRAMSLLLPRALRENGPRFDGVHCCVTRWKLDIPTLTPTSVPSVQTTTAGSVTRRASLPLAQRVRVRSPRTPDPTTAGAFAHWAP